MNKERYSFFLHNYRNIMLICRDICVKIKAQTNFEAIDKLAFYALEGAAIAIQTVDIHAPSWHDSFHKLVRTHIRHNVEKSPEFTKKSSGYASINFTGVTPQIEPVFAQSFVKNIAFQKTTKPIFYPQMSFQTLSKLRNKPQNSIPSRIPNRRKRGITTPENLRTFEKHVRHFLDIVSSPPNNECPSYRQAPLHRPDAASLHTSTRSPIIPNTTQHSKAADIAKILAKSVPSLQNDIEIELSSPSGTRIISIKTLRQMQQSQQSRLFRSQRVYINASQIHQDTNTISSKPFCAESAESPIFNDESPNSNNSQDEDLEDACVPHRLDTSSSADSTPPTFNSSNGSPTSDGDCHMPMTPSPFTNPPQDDDPN